MKRREQPVGPDDVMTRKKFLHWRWHQGESLLVVGCPICEQLDSRSTPGWPWVDETTIRPFTGVSR